MVETFWRFDHDRDGDFEGKPITWAVTHLWMIPLWPIALVGFVLRRLKEEAESET